MFVRDTRRDRQVLGFARSPSRHAICWRGRMARRARDSTLAIMTKRPATYADLEALPRNQVGEILGGVLYAFPRPAVPHARATSRLGAELGGPFDRGRGGPGGWVVLDEPELHFADDVLVPDLAAWRRERMPELPAAAFITMPPDWVGEVLSPSTAGIDRSEKVPIYRRERVAHVWLLDPLAQTLEILTLDGDGYRIVATAHGDAKVRAEPFDAIELELAAMWAR
jgi:Uma2 family endonuclease